MKTIEHKKEIVPYIAEVYTVAWASLVREQIPGFQGYRRLEREGTVWNVLEGQEFRLRPESSSLTTVQRG